MRIGIEGEDVVSLNEDITEMENYDNSRRSFEQRIII